MPKYEEYINMIKPLWDSCWITNMGEYHQKLEEELKEYLKVSNVSLVVNGHMALEMSLQAMNFPEGGEVITTPFTFISTTHAIVRNGLVPVFCDIKLGDYTIDEDLIESLITEKTVAIVPVHVYGNICNIDIIQRIAEKYNLKNFGIRGEELIVEVGANAKLNEFSAIMGICNLKYVQKYIELRKDRVNYYIHKLSDLEGVVIQRYDHSKVKYNYGYFPVRFRDKITRDRIRDVLMENGIVARKYFYPITADADCFKGKYKNNKLDVSREVADCILVLPLYPDLELEHIDRICNIIKSLL